MDIFRKYLAVIFLSVICHNAYATSFFDFLDDLPTQTNKLIAAKQFASASEKIEIVNKFFNKKIAYNSDRLNWELDDYLAKPAEILKLGSGDCDDYAIVKYDTLKKMGIPTEQMVLMYVFTDYNKKLEGHMTLGVYSEEHSDYLVLDNMMNEILPFKKRKDLTLVFGFSAFGVWTGNFSIFNAGYYELPQIMVKEYLSVLQ